ncbi:para-aminobenzoate synthetase / 4-amino-4-deoxychorismate lyase [Alkalispirochaeta americana]|uniref:Para-aminobenzoate synthetase / 4-amino-4-deoxychorismate lyase n=1 Tax=Alkalispirochaeta americana TaxID=159291 RepID=A0A1N6R9U5_9SPIO|nr:aminodeoxychorismate synthase component I [Alkalispirochaeta americana]SIQ25619.1 para-aminobenzoate synthetase / 4-amino-4-deoxychorismate lyase [Alkalispirochaeta americana]
MIREALLKTAPTRWERFSDPLETVFVPPCEPREAAWRVPAALARLEDRAEKLHLPAVGFISYEAGCAYGLAVHPPAETPLLCFTFFASREPFHPGDPPRGEGYTTGTWEPSLEAQAYREKVLRVKEYLAAGETYQINLTFPLRTSFSGDPRAFFFDICAAQGGAYAAFLEMEGGQALLSASPELFLHRQGTHLQALPMKGTARRGRTLREDQVHLERLRHCPKERAENLMITDMIRNDLGRIARIGSVRVPELFSVERYPRVLQMVSSVTAESEATLPDLLEATFPCASITGAPKQRTMELIRTLEDEPRGIYTGSVGIIESGRRLRLNVAIRTVQVDLATGTARFGVGSGIVWDSDPHREYQECATKASILRVPDPPFALLETVRWNRLRGVTRFEGHLKRARESARYFNMTLPREFRDHTSLHEAISAALEPPRETSPKDPPQVSRDWRVRLILGPRLEIEGTPLPEATCSPAEGQPGEPLPRRRTALATSPVSPDNPWLYHKTTRRELYEHHLASRPEAGEVLLFNTRGNLTEGCTTSIFLERKPPHAARPYLATPPLSEGLLPGVFREELLHPPPGRRPWTPKGMPLVEEVLPLRLLEEVLQGKVSLYLGNSLRGWMKATLDDSVPLPPILEDYETQDNAL